MVKKHSYFSKQYLDTSLHELQVEGVGMVKVEEAALSLHLLILRQVAIERFLYKQK